MRSYFKPTLLLTIVQYCKDGLIFLCLCRLCRSGKVLVQPLDILKEFSGKHEVFDAEDISCSHLNWCRK